MVSTWRFWSGKEINLTRSHPFQLLFMLAIVLYVSIRYSQVVFFVVALSYMFSGIWARAAYSWSASAQTAGSRLGRGAGICRLGAGSLQRTPRYPVEEGIPCTRLLLPEPLPCWARS